MKTTIKIAVALALLLGITGFRVGEILDYLQLGRDALATAVQDEIPVKLKLRRLEKLVDELDTRIDDDQQLLAERAIALEDAEVAFKSRLRQEKLQFTSMRRLRDELTDESDFACSSVNRPRSARKLNSELKLYRGRLESDRRFKAAITVQQEAYGTLSSRIDQYAEDRALLRQRLESLKSRALVVDSTEQGSGAQNTSIKEAEELASDIERKIRIAEKTAELKEEDRFSTRPNTLDDDAVAAFDAFVSQHAAD
jgi:hypothetical protein